MTWKVIIALWLTLIIIASLVFPIVDSPQHWYDLPNIRGLEQRARIMFFHVPMAWVTVIAFLVSMIYGIRYLVRKDAIDDVRSVSSAGLGFLFCFLATVTGSVWAKFNWGSFWNWDPRETSIFLLLLIYAAYFVLRTAVENEEKRGTLAAVYSIIAFVTVPFFIFIMPRVVPSLHPGSKGDPEGSGPIVQMRIDPNMAVLFFGALIGFTALYFWMWSVRVRAERVNFRHLNIAEQTGG
ncbi:MAG: cytochrome c biogenesis protein [Bacteroidota bacterium]